MPYTTAVSHYVRENILKDWLAHEFGGAETGSWSCEEIANGDNGYWQVTAPRAITPVSIAQDWPYSLPQYGGGRFFHGLLNMQDEQTQLELKSRPTRVRTFGT